MKATGAHRPYVAGVTALVAPTFTASAPNTAAKDSGTNSRVAVTLTGTFTAALPTNMQYLLTVDGVAEAYCTITNGTTLVSSFRTNRAPGVYKLRVVDPQGQAAPAAGVNFTVT